MNSFFKRRICRDSFVDVSQILRFVNFTSKKAIKVMVVVIVIVMVIVIMME